MNRREFLKVAGVVSGCLGIALYVPGKNQTTIERQPIPPFSPNLFVSISRDNQLVFTVTKQEMGQGSSTGLAMIFADELGADWQKVSIQYSDYDPRFNYRIQGVTGGSSSIERCWQPLREAAALTRELFIRAAAEKWRVDPAQCYAENSLVIHRKTEQRIPFGELIELASRMPLPEKALLKEPQAFRYIGKPVANLRTAAIVSGTERYGIDVQLPGLRYAAIERSPVFMGTIKTYDDREARQVAGVIDVVKIDQIRRQVQVGFSSENDTTAYPYTVQEGIAVIATSTWAAFQGKKALKIAWEGGKHQDADDHTMPALIGAAAGEPGQPSFQYGDAAKAWQTIEQTVEARYEVTFQAHGLMEPLNATAHFQDNRCELWVGHQFGKRVAEEVAHLLQIPVENVVVHILPSGGGSGRRWEADFPVEAALLAKHTNGPVKVTWTREDDFRHDYYHAYQQDHHRVGLNAAGDIAVWELKRYTFDHFRGWFWNPYGHGVAHRSMHVVQLESPLQTGSWRSVDSHRETFARECLIDELAALLKKDPLAYRLELLNKPLLPPGTVPDAAAWRERADKERTKTKRVLQLAAQQAGWGKKKGMGIAVTGYCAQIAKVEWHQGKLVVKKITAAVDCGTVVNPSLVSGQVEGSIIWGLQAVLYGGIRLKDGKVQQRNFHDYPMIRLPETPEIEVHLVESTEPPSGTGEPSVPPLAPAVANALFTLTGRRVRSIPFRLDDQKL